MDAVVLSAATSGVISYENAPSSLPRCTSWHSRQVVPARTAPSMSIFADLLIDDHILAGLE